MAWNTSLRQFRSMPLYMDVHHDVGQMSQSELDAAHAADVAHQAAFDVEFIRFWYNADQGKIFCLSRAPSPEQPMAVHRQAGHPAAEIYEVQEFE